MTGPRKIPMVKAAIEPRSATLEVVTTEELVYNEKKTCGEQSRFDVDG